MYLCSLATRSSSSRSTELGEKCRAMLLEAEVNIFGKLPLYYCFLLGNNKSDRSAVTVGYTPTPTLLLPSSLLSSTAWHLKGNKPCCKLRECHEGSECLGLLQLRNKGPLASSPESQWNLRSHRTVACLAALTKYPTKATQARKGSLWFMV